MMLLDFFLLYKNIFILFILGILAARLSYPILNFIITKMSRAFQKSTQQKILSLSKAPYALLILCAIWYFSLKFLPIQDEWSGLIIQTLKIILGYSFIIIGYQFLDILEIYLKMIMEKNNKDTLHKHLLPYSKKIVKTIFAIVIILLILQNSGFNVTSLLASLGLGGVAIALGAKETLSNLFGGITIIIDKPFSVGDWIVCGEFEGTVEDIGFRSTKIKTFYDSILTLPNSIISDSTIDNLSLREFRRARFTLDLNCHTTPEELEYFIEGVKNILKANSYVKKDYYQVYFSGYGPFSLQIFINFFLKVNDWDSELLQKQNVLLEILRLSNKLQISFAFPTQTLNIPSLPKSQDLASRTPLSKEDLKNYVKEFGPNGNLSQPEGLGLYKSRKNKGI